MEDGRGNSFSELLTNFVVLGFFCALKTHYNRKIVINLHSSYNASCMGMMAISNKLSST